jgi:hypothetical protein
MEEHNSQLPGLIEPAEAMIIDPFYVNISDPDALVPYPSKKSGTAISLRCGASTPRAQNLKRSRMITEMPSSSAGASVEGTGAEVFIDEVFRLRDRVDHLERTNTLHTFSEPHLEHQTPREAPPPIYEV